jgi:hypothetical protein
MAIRIRFGTNYYDDIDNSDNWCVYSYFPITHKKNPLSFTLFCSVFLLCLIVFSGTFLPFLCSTLHVRIWPLLKRSFLKCSLIGQQSLTSLLRERNLWIPPLYLSCSTCHFLLWNVGICYMLNFLYLILGTGFVVCLCVLHIIITFLHNKQLTHMCK